MRTKPHRFATLCLLPLFLTGCSGHGEYTGAHLNSAKEKMAMLKSGTEWQMAQQQFLAGELNKALKTIDKSLSLNPNVCKSHILKGRILLEKNDIEHARQSFAEAENLDSTSAEAAYYAGIIHERINQPEAALERYQAAMSRDATNAQYVIAAAEMLISLDRQPESRALLEEKKGEFAYSAGIRQSLGHLAMLAHDPGAAAALFQEAQLLAPEDASIIEDLAEAEFQALRFADAEFHFATLVKKYTTEGVCARPDLQHQQARCLVQLNQCTEARAILRELVANPDGNRSLDLWVELGLVGYMLKDLNTVQDAAGRTVSIAPDRHEGFLLRAMAFKLRGDLHSALEMSAKAAAMSGADESPWIFHGTTAQELGLAQVARAAYECALRVNPQSAQAQSLLATFAHADAAAAAEQP